ncbi:MAG: division plane positioning ATPase MipZ [Acidimicrobiales bacterium]
MEPTFYFRLLRHRWKPLAAFMIAGAIAGFLLTWYPSRGPIDTTTYWLANHKLIVTSEAAESGRHPNLQQTALVVTGGALPEELAQSFDVEEIELTKLVRTVADSEVSVIEISAVGTDPDRAAEVSDAFAMGLTDFLDSRELAAWEADVSRIQAEVDRHLIRLEEIGQEQSVIQGQIVVLESQAPAPGEVPDPVDEAQRRQDLRDLNDDLAATEVERASRTALYEDSLADLDRTTTDGVPASIMATLDIIPPYQIAKSTYGARVGQGRKGENNYTRRTVPEDGGGGINIGEQISSPPVGAIMGMIAGLLIGIGAILIHLKLDPRLRTKAQVEEAFGVPVLAEIPKFSGKTAGAYELHAASRPRSVVTESYRVVRSALLFAKATADTAISMDELAPPRYGRGAHAVLPPDSDLSSDVIDLIDADTRDMRVVMITSPGPSEGKTTTTANMAVVLAEAGYNVLVVNCDYRLPKLHHYFGQPHIARKTVETEVPGVTLITDVADSSSPNPTTIVETQRNVIRKARDRYDVVLLDTAPLLATNDAQALLPVCDMVLLVAREGKTDREGAHETVELLERHRANLAGVVLTGSSGFGRGRYYYKYRYGTYYERSDNEPPPEVVDPAVASRAARAGVSSN